MQDKIFGCKSAAVYNKWHDRFISFLSENDHQENLESILNYFTEKSTLYAVSTLWQAVRGIFGHE